MEVFRFASSIALDQLSALYPNVDAPFEDAVDVVNRLLPYHIFQQPRASLQATVTNAHGKGKAKASDVLIEIQGASSNKQDGYNSLRDMQRLNLLWIA